MTQPVSIANRQTAGAKACPGPLRTRLRREQRTIAAMLRIYCRHHHGIRDGLCNDCAGLHAYAEQRLGACPFQAEKPACNHCEVHCYSARMRERVRAVMRYAGPRMLLRHPWLAIRHLLDERRPVPSLAPRKTNATPDP
ncbi:MAG: nitrous oxide-stimulated promoter family protein [Gammaproteobacteria bacterium]|jgi:hypothetical protein|nr:nitrous oxide-stimulated promoter family protein [Gammaproteobacteria bacterium]